MKDHKWFGLRTLAVAAVLIVGLPLSPILLTQRWGWWEAWVFAGVTTAGFFVSRYLASRRHPDLLDERARMLDHEDTEPFDKVLAPVVGIGGNLIPLLAGLEVRFLGAPTVPPGAAVACLLAITAGYALGSWALIENRFFSGTVRIQTEREHVVVDTGPYRFVRHPGYAGALVMFAAAPVLFGTVWTGGFTALICLALVVRTALEDKALQEKLPGYREYAARTRYRLVPGLW